MEFDKNKVYTSVNADELKTGSKVICANSFGCLKRYVKKGASIETLKKVEDDECQYRFVTEGNVEYALAYLVKSPEEKKLKWTNLKPGDRIETKDKHGGRHGAIVTYIDCNSRCAYHVFTGYWISDEDLAEWEKV